MLFFLEIEIKRETPKDAKLCSEKSQNNAKFPEGMQFPCYPKHLLGSASLKEKNASTLATNCRRRVIVKSEDDTNYHSSNCDWVYWPCYVWKMISLRNWGRKESQKKTTLSFGHYTTPAGNFGNLSTLKKVSKSIWTGFPTPNPLPQPNAKQVEHCPKERISFLGGPPKLLTPVFVFSATVLKTWNLWLGYDNCKIEWKLKWTTVSYFSAMMSKRKLVMLE